MTLTIRPLEARDAEAIERLELECRSFHATRAPDQHRRLVCSGDALIQRWKEKGVLCWVGEVEGTVVAFITVEPTEQGQLPTDPVMPEKVWHIGTLVVETGFRHQGIGRELLRYVEEQAKIANQDSLSLHCIANNPEAAALYTQEGFYPLKVKMRKPLK